MEPPANLLEFKGQAHAVDPGKARAGEAEAGREAETDALGQLPAEKRGDVVGGIAHGEREGISQAAVALDAGDELLRAKGTFPAAGRAAQRTRGSHRVTELPRVMAEVFLRDEVLRDVPVLHVGRENQLQFGFVLMVAAQRWR